LGQLQLTWGVAVSLDAPVEPVVSKKAGNILTAHPYHDAGLMACGVWLAGWMLDRVDSGFSKRPAPDLGNHGRMIRR
jgi:hypothetical protein